MLSPKGPSGIVAGSGGVHSFADSETSFAFCDAKLLACPENRIADAENRVTANPQRATIARITGLLLESTVPRQGRGAPKILRRHVTVVSVALQERKGCR